MSYRLTHKNKWSDDWFLGLSSNGKVLFDYLTDNCDNAGFFELSPRLICFMTNLTTKESESAIIEIEKCYVKSPNGKFIWLRKFLLHQKNIPLNEKNNYHKQIVKIIVSKLEAFDYNEEILNILPEDVRGIEGGKKGVQKIEEGASVQAKRGLEGANLDENSEKGKENLAPSVGLCKPLSISNSISKDNTNTILNNNASDDFEKKSSSLLNENILEVESEEKKTEKSSDDDIEFVEAEVIDDKKEEKEKKIAPKKEKEAISKQGEQSLHNKLKIIFLGYYKDSKKTDYYWNGKDGRHMNEIIKKLKFHLKPLYATNGHADEEIDEQYIETAFNLILMGLNEKFTIDNLTIAMLNSRFQENLTKIKSKIGKESEIEKKRYDF